jgi:hypothetical protein
MKLPTFNTYTNFSRHQSYSFTIVPLFVLDKSMAYNTLASKICVKLLMKASKNSNSNAQHFLFGYANPFMMFTPCSLHSQVTNSLLLS